MPAVKFTKRLIDALEVTGKQYEVPDSEVKGLTVRVGANGKKSYCLVYRIGRGRGAQKGRLTLGSVTEWSIEQARDWALKKLVEAREGNDPAEPAKIEKATPFFKDCFSMFIEYHKTKVKPKTIAEYEAGAVLHILPRFGNKKITKIQHSDIESLHYSLRGTQYQANRILALLSVFFNWCEKMEYIPRNSNPARGVEKYKEVPRKVYIKDSELERIGKVFLQLKEENNSDFYVLYAIELYFYTGARRNEILNLKWENIDFDNKKIVLPDSKTGFKEIPLSDYVISLLNEIPREQGYIFKGRGKTGHIVCVKGAWKRILERAGLAGSGYRIHDLRHTFASKAVSNGYSLPLIGAMLGHKNIQTTERYSHLQNNIVQQAMEETASKIQQIMNKKE